MSSEFLRNCLRSIAKVVITDRPSRTKKPTRMNLELLESRELLTLSPVSTSAPFPYSAIVKLYITYPDNKGFVGSGALIDNFHVLTAGHNTYSAADGGFAKTIHVIPEMNGTYEPYGSAYMVYERTYSSFVNYNKTNPGTTLPGINDIALLTLDRNIGRYTGTMNYGFDDNNARFAAGRIFNTAGYPARGGYDGLRMYASSGPIAGLSANQMGIQYYQSQITAFAGQSGGPVWEYNPSNGSRTILGVHVAGNNTPTSLNFATRITHAIFNDLGRWRAQDIAPRAQLAALGTGAGGGVAGAFAAVTNVGPTLTGLAAGRSTATSAITVSLPITTLGSRESTTGVLWGTTVQPAGPMGLKKQVAATQGLPIRPVQVVIRAELDPRLLDDSHKTNVLVA